MHDPDDVERMRIVHVAHVLEGNVRNKDIAHLHIFVASESIEAQMSLQFSLHKVLNKRGTQIIYYSIMLV